MRKFFLFFIFLFFMLFLFQNISGSCSEIISYYPLNEVSIPFTDDFKGINDGIPVDYEVLQNHTGKYNYSYNFGLGGSTGVLLNDSNFNDYIDYNTSWAVSFWIRANDLGAGSINMLFGQQDDPVTHTSTGWSIFHINGLIFLQLNAGGCGYTCNELQVHGNYTLPDVDNFYFVVVNYDGAGGVEMWFNGVNYGVNSEGSISSSFHNAENYTLGTQADFDASNNPPYLDDVYIFSSVLDENTILYMNNSVIPFMDSCSIKIQEIPQQNLTFNETIILNLSDYFTNWYDIALISFDPVTFQDIITITGYLNDVAPYYKTSIDTGGIINISSYYRNYTDNIDVFACGYDSNGIDVFCPVLDFPESCNISAFYTADSCINTNFTLFINGTQIFPVEVVSPFSLYYRIEDYDYEYFNFNMFFENYNTLNVKYQDTGISSFNQSLTCILGNINTTNKTGILNTSFICEDYNAILRVYSNNISSNITFYINASNSNNSLTDFFIISTGSLNLEVNVFERYFNFSKLMTIFPEIEKESHANITALIFIVAMFVIGIIFIGLPLKFSNLALILITCLTLFSIFLMAYLEWISFVWFIIPLVLLIAYILTKFIFKGS